MKCTRCKKECEPTVFSSGDYDPFCSRGCHDQYYIHLQDEMGRVNEMTDAEFSAWLGVPSDPPRDVDTEGWQKTGF